MAKQTINIGSAANDGTGDPLRTAFDKINDNFSEIYTELGGTTTSNIKITGNTIGTDLGTGNLQLTADGGTIVIDSSVALQLTDHTDDAIVKFDADGNLVDSTITYDGTTLTAGDVTIDQSTGTITTASTDIILAPGGGDVLPANTEVESLGGASNIWLTIWAKRLNVTGDRINLASSYSPPTSVGTAGDVEGDIAVDAGFFYYCTASHDGSTDIWVRVALDATPF
jgi:hypothetical protein